MVEMYFLAWFPNWLEQQVPSLRESLLTHADEQIVLWHEIRGFLAGSHSLEEIRTAIGIMETAEDFRMDLAA